MLDLNIDCDDDYESMAPKQPLSSQQIRVQLDLNVDDDDDEDSVIVHSSVSIIQTSSSSSFPSNNNNENCEEDEMEIHTLKRQRQIRFQHIICSDELLPSFSKKRKFVISDEDEEVSHRKEKKSKKDLDLITDEELYAIKDYEEYIGKKLTGYDGWLAFPRTQSLEYSEHLVLFDLNDLHRVTRAKRKVIPSNWYRFCKKCKSVQTSKASFLRHLRSNDHRDKKYVEEDDDEETQSESEEELEVRKAFSTNDVYDHVDTHDCNLFRRHSNKDF